MVGNSQPLGQDNPGEYQGTEDIQAAEKYIYCPFPEYIIRKSTTL
jgi:hypothetical protein